MSQLCFSGIAPVTISREDQDLFVQLGVRIARARNQQGVTQQQLAEWLGVSQQTVNAYEVGRRRMAVSALPAVAKLLGMALVDLIGQQAPPIKRGAAPKLQRQMARIQELPKAQQRCIMQMLDTALQQGS